GVYDRLPKDWPWPLIGIGAAAAIVFFAIGLGAGQWLSGGARPQPAAVPAPVAAIPSPELLARLDRLETQIGAPPTQDPQLRARIDKLESLLNAAPKEDPQLQARLAKLEAQLGAPRANDQQLLARIAAAEAAVKTFADVTASREKRSDDIAALARDARDRASSAASAAEAAQKAQTASPEARADLDALTTRIAALEQSARSSQAELARRMSADDAKGRFAIAAIALRDAVDNGMPYTAELAAVKSLSGDAAAFAPLEPLAASGVPSAAALGRELASLMPAIWKTARKQESQSGSFLEKLQANAEKIVRIRPAGEAVGDDPASIRARIETRAGSADIRGAIAELSSLPPDARAPAEAWIRKAQARQAAIAAARSVSQTALGALVKPGS
ncbi:MAG: COG4223 family protein, partial [Pseudorhodoplanes sp.]